MPGDDRIRELEIMVRALSHLAAEAHAQAFALGYATRQLHGIDAAEWRQRQTAAIERAWPAVQDRLRSLRARYAQHADEEGGIDFDSIDWDGAPEV